MKRRNDTFSFVKIILFYRAHDLRNKQRRREKTAGSNFQFLFSIRRNVV